MTTYWCVLSFAVLILAVVYQQFRIHRIQVNSRKREELFQIVTENAADMIALVDMKGRRLYNSPAYKRILGYSPAELGETSSFEQIHPDDRFRVLEAAREARETGIGQRLEYRIQHKDGTWRVLESVASTVRDSKGEVAKLVIVNRDITERKHAEEQLEHNLFHDELTGLPNRRLFLDRLQDAYERPPGDSEKEYALLIVNLDRFKVFNTTLGTAAGDRLLQELSRRLSGCVRVKEAHGPREREKAADTLLARLGSDEFAILLTKVSDPSDALRIGHRIQAAIAQPYLLDSQEVRVSASIGIAMSANTHQGSDSTLKDADVALRRAKALGGSRCELFDEAMHTRAVGRLRLENDLRTALKERQFRVLYQPIVRLDSRRAVSFEALLRWEHPSQGLISPYRFIDAAEDTGLLVSIGHWLIFEACAQLHEWETGSLASEPLSITVNVSARQLADARLLTDLQDALKQTGVDPARLQFEITEKVAAADPKLTSTVLAHLKHMGISVVLDDFGIGSASLSGLRQFPVDALKIDRSLVRQMQSDRSAEDMIEVIITLAHKMKLQAIAEGIETVRQFQRLLELECEMGQGYYFSEPLDGKAALEFLRQHTSRTAGAGAN